MNSEDAKAMAARTLTRDATLEELRETARNLRALSSESALADLVEAKIDQLLASGQTGMGTSEPESAAGPYGPEQFREPDKSPQDPSVNLPGWG